jgi:pyrimidine-nucleoside phosphorylase
VLATDIIRKKRFGGELSRDEMAWFLQKYLSDEIKDYQVSALLMAICIRGMNARETTDLTLLMRDSGRVFNFDGLRKYVVDKHSTGGVGDKTSLIVAPLVAAAGLLVPMVAGRGLGHTGGTLDKLESLPGFRVDLSAERFSDLVRSLGFAIIGQTSDMCPADKRLYALRDVTGTVDSLELICGSIMSKKLAEGLNGLVIDVKFGTGAFMKTRDDARHLAQNLIRIGENASVHVRALLTDMNQPLGRYTGNGLEVIECLEILKGQTCVRDGIDLYADTRELSLELAAHMIHLSDPQRSLEDCRSLVAGILSSGKAMENFEKMCLAQGNGLPKEFKTPYLPVSVTAEIDGYLAGFECEQLGLACIELGAGRKTADQKIDPWSGLEFVVKVGQKIKKGQPLVAIYGHRSEDVLVASQMVRSAVRISTAPVPAPSLVAEIL